MAPTRKAPTGAEGARIRERYERLLAGGVAIFSERELAAVLQRVVDVAREVVGSRYAALGVLSTDGAELAEFVTSGMTPDLVERIGALPRGHGLLGIVIREARPIRTADIAGHAQRSGFPAHHPPMKSFLGVPVLVRGRVFGNLYLTDKTGAAEFDAADEAIAVLLATQAAVAVENARLHEESTRLLEQVQGMHRQRDLFFAMMNHELRNSLTGVYGWAERLVRGKNPESTAAAAREVFEASERTITLLSNFLDLMRLESGHVRPVWRAIDVPGAVTRAARNLAPAAAEKSVAIETMVPDDLPPLVTDPVRLEQILINLVSNAVRHGPAGEPVRIDAVARDGEMAFRVADRGPGIPPELHPRIFEPFERFDPHSGAGTGLGLAVSRRLATVLGGRLGFDHEQRQGATFELVLPLTPPQT